jgi:UDP-glucose 6-dehydrogenase
MVIVGFGWVGQANALALKILGFDVSYFDPSLPPHHYTNYAATYASLEKLASIREKDSEHTWYVICVGDRVSDDGTQDISNITRALDSLKGARGGIILRSTILPDLLEKLPFDYYVPEFLHEKKAVEECVNPFLFVIGSRPEARPEPRVFSLWRGKARKSFSGTPREASFIKYLSNLWNALRIAFVNEFGDAIGRPSGKKELAEIDGIIGFLFENRNYSRYGRAFGGHCLPKDSRAFIARYRKEFAGLPLMAGMYASNAEHQRLEAQFPLMPEWYSEWPERHVSGKLALRSLSHAITKYLRDPMLVWHRLLER